jgi:hypothetical protein
MSKLVAIRIPDDLAERLAARCNIRKHSKTDVLLESIERGWDNNGNSQDVPQVAVCGLVVKEPERVDDRARSVQELGSAPGTNPHSMAAKPMAVSMNDLRSICAGNIPQRERDTGPVDEHETAICAIDWWEDGEHYQCLMDKGHKSTKHGQHGAVRKLDD